MKIFIISAFILCSIYSKASHSVTFIIDGLKNTPVFLTNYSGDKNSIIDSAYTDFNGKVLFNFPKGTNTGIYKAIFSKSDFIDFIYNNENIIIHSNSIGISENVKIVESKENSIYFEFVKLKIITDNKINLLNEVLDNYQKGNYYNQTIEEYNSVVNNFSNYINSIIINNKNLFCTKLINVQKEIYPPANLSYDEKIDFRRKNYFATTDFSDESLLTTDVFTQKVIGYLGLYSSKNFSQEQQYYSFAQAIDTIYSKIGDSPLVLDQVTDYLISGFENMGFNEITSYISDKYLEINSCQDAENKTTLQRKIMSHKALIPGKEHPQFTININKEKQLSSDDFHNKYVLLFFWSTSCPHCTESIKQIMAMHKYAGQNFDVITISLDEDIEMWNSFIAENGLTSFTNICDGEGWDGKMAELYNIYATPTFFLLHKGKIIGNPIEIQGLGRLLQTHGILK